MGNTEKVNTVEWFFGYGGNHIGLKRAGVDMRILALCEIEEFAIQGILEKMEDGRLPLAPIWNDCKTFPREPFKNRVDLFVASYPCQPFSAAGKRLGKEDPRHLWPYVYEFVRDVRPTQCFFENVEGHVTKGLQEVVESLEGLGYEVSWGVFSASEVGAPHQRKRVFILADSEDNGCQGWEGEPQAPKQAGVQVGSSMRESEGRKELANSQCERLERRLYSREDERETARGSESPHGDSRCFYDIPRTIWPSRPGEPQHEWEPPRTIDGKLNPDWVEPLMGLPVGWTGTGNRVDRLRLLGNGVAPQTAEIAWKVLNA